MNTFLKNSVLALGLGATALTAAAPAQAQVARYRGHDDTGVALVAGLAGLAVGAALASGDHRDYDNRDDGYYYDGYDPGYADSGYYATPGYYVAPSYYSYQTYSYPYSRGYRGYSRGYYNRGYQGSGYYQGHGGYGGYGHHRGR